MECKNKDHLSLAGSDFWDNKYLNNETGWDMKQVSPPLKAYIDSLQNKDLKILIPGCGNAYEAKYLLQKEFNKVTLIDISKVLTERLKGKFKDKPITIVNENFFHAQGEYDLILEQTFFCALDPSLRENTWKNVTIFSVMVVKLRAFYLIKNLPLKNRLLLQLMMNTKNYSNRFLLF